MHRRPRLLSVHREGGALCTRTEVLRYGGYEVVAVGPVAEALTAIERERFDLVIIGQLYVTAEKNLIATEARRAGGKVLCMYSESYPPDIPAANAFIHNLEGPERLLAAVAKLVKKKAASARIPDR